MNKKKHNLTILINLLITVFVILLTRTSNRKLVKEKVFTDRVIKERKEEYLSCPYLDKERMEEITRDNYFFHKEDLKKLEKIPTDYVFKLWKKGYHPLDIIELWNWNLSEIGILPDLKAERETGVIGELFITHNIGTKEWEKLDEKTKEEYKYLGGVKKLVVIIKKVPIGKGKIFMDEGYYQSPFVLEGKQTGDYYKKLINFFFKEEKLNVSQYNIYVLSALGIDYLGKERYSAGKVVAGKSAGSALYLVLLSALYKKPISKEVASTGVISLTNKRVIKGKVNEQEFDIIPGTNLPVGGLKWKIPSALERGYNKLVISQYNHPSFLLSEYQRPGKWTGSWTYDEENRRHDIYRKEGWGKLAEDFTEVVPEEIRNKFSIKLVKNTAQIKKLVLEGDLYYGNRS